MDRSNLPIKVLVEENEEETRLFWRRKSSEDRISAVEFLREQYYAIQGYQTVPPIVRDIRIVSAEIENPS
jgi:hypothetical protein